MRWMAVFFVLTVPAAADDIVDFLDAVNGGPKTTSKIQDLTKNGATPLPPNVPQKVAQADDWTMRTSTSEMDDKETVTLHTVSMRQVRDGFNRSYTPTLWVICSEGKTNVYVNFDGLFVATSSSFGQMTFRIDKEAPLTWEFNESTDNKALGLWNGQGIPFIKRMIGKSRILIRATPFNESPVQMEFSLAGLDAKLLELRRACKW